jgi:hypothetical protein
MNDALPLINFLAPIGSGASAKTTGMVRPHDFPWEVADALRLAKKPI